MINKKFKNIQIVFLSIGVGAGSKYFQSFLDGHKEVLMIPGYILMYLFPHWREWQKKKITSWNEYCNLLFEYHPSLLDTNKLPGSSSLNKLGSKGNQKIIINKNKFKNELLFILKGEKINFKNFFIAIHLAYAKCIKENLRNKKIILFHAHVPLIVKDLLIYFPNSKVISMSREFKSNISKRINSSFEKINDIYLNKTDEIFFRSRSYRNQILINLFGLYWLKEIKKKNHRVVLHEDLILRKKSLLKETAKFLKIKFYPSMLKSSFGKLEWTGDFYFKKEKKNKLGNSILNYEKKNYFPHEMYWYESLNYKNYIKYNYRLTKINKNNLFTKIKTFFLIFLPSKKEMNVFSNSISPFKIFNYLKNILFEIKNFKRLKEYKKIAFYKHKWTNKGFPFALINLVIEKQKKNLVFWKIVYFFIKIFQLLYLPICVVKEYIWRIFICCSYFFKRNQKNFTLPNKI